MRARLVGAAAALRGRRGFAGDVRHMLLGQVGRVVLQGLYFVLAARALGATDFGALVAVQAVVAVVAPLASFGCVTLLLRDVVRRPEGSAVWLATGLFGAGVLGLLATGGLGALAVVLGPPMPVGFVVAMAASELLGARFVELAGTYHQGRGRMSLTAGLALALQAARLLAVGGLVLSGAAVSPGSWGVAHAAATAVVAVVAVVAAVRHAGLARPDLGRLRRDLREGAMLAVGSSAQTVYNDIDKVMLAAMAGPLPVATYSAGYRFVDLAYAPLRALLGAAQPRFFREGTRGARAAARLAGTLAWPALGYATLAATALVLLAPLAPLVLGPTFTGAPEAVRLLAVLLVLKAVHYLAADALTGSGHQGLRTASQVAVAALNVGLNLVLIPLASWRGAVVASLVCDALLGVVLWCALLRLARRPAAEPVAGQPPDGAPRRRAPAAA